MVDEKLKAANELLNACKIALQLHKKMHDFKFVNKVYINAVEQELKTAIENYEKLC